MELLEIIVENEKMRLCIPNSLNVHLRFIIMIILELSKEYVSLLGLPQQITTDWVT